MKRANTHDPNVSAQAAEYAYELAQQLLRKLQARLSGDAKLTEAEVEAALKEGVTAVYLIGVGDTHMRYASMDNKSGNPYPTDRDRLKIGLSAAGGSVLGLILGMLFAVVGVVSGHVGAIVLPILGSIGGGAAGAAIQARRGSRSRPALAAGVGGVAGPLVSGIAAGVLANPGDPTLTTSSGQWGVRWITQPRAGVNYFKRQGSRWQRVPLSAVPAGVRESLDDALRHQQFNPGTRARALKGRLSR